MHLVAAVQKPHGSSIFVRYFVYFLNNFQTSLRIDELIDRESNEALEQLIQSLFKIQKTHSARVTFEIHYSFYKYVHDNCRWIINRCLLYFDELQHNYVMFHLFVNTGADTEFLVQLWLHQWYNIRIGYRCTTSNWLSGTRSYGKYFRNLNQNYLEFNWKCPWTESRANASSNADFWNSSKTFN